LEEKKAQPHLSVDPEATERSIEIKRRRKCPFPDDSVFLSHVFVLHGDTPLRFSHLNEGVKQDLVKTCYEVSKVVGYKEFFNFLLELKWKPETAEEKEARLEEEHKRREEERKQKELEEQAKEDAALAQALQDSTETYEAEQKK